MRAPLIFCPQCGANLLIESKPGVFSGDPFDMQPPEPEPASHQPFNSSAFKARLFDALPEMAAKLRTRMGMPNDTMAFDYAAHDEREFRRPRVPHYAWGALIVLGFAVGAYAMFHRSAREPAHGVQIIEGAVLRPQGASATTIANAPAVPQSVSRNVPRAVPEPLPESMSQPVAIERNDSIDSNNSFAQQNIQRGNSTTSRAVMRDLTNARASLDRHSLWPARKSVMSALAMQPGNVEAQRLRAELAVQEQQRDALIADARQCARERQWWCVRESAGKAASVDISSREAKRLLARASGGESARMPNPVRAIMSWLQTHGSAPPPVNDNSPYQH